MTKRTLSSLSVLSILSALAIPSVAQAGGPLFDRINGALNPQPCGGAGCWTNHLRVTDIDGDDDLDVIFANYADFFGGGNSPQPLAIYTNDGTGTLSNNSAAAVGGLTTNAHQICVGDVEGDGDKDIYVPDGTGAGHELLINDGSGVFVDEGDMRLPGTAPDGGACRFGDMDGDGDLDLLVSDGYGGGAADVLMYANDGDGNFSDVPGTFPGPINGSDIDDIEVFDADRDFDLDVFANAHEGGYGGYWLNNGDATFTNESFPAPATGNFHYNSAVCDVDGDGDLDMWIDNIGGSFTEQLLVNDGTGVFSDVTGAQVSGNPGADDNGVICADIDNDGDMDGVVVNLGPNERYLQNDGAGNFTYVAGVFPSDNDCTLWGEFGDLNDDGRFDLVTGQGECSSSNEVDLGNAGLAVDDTAPVLIAIEENMWAEGEDPVVRFAVSDRTVTDEGPHLARAFVAVDPEGDNTIVDAAFVGGDLFRAVLPTVDADGYEYQVCAEDRAGNLACSDAMNIGDGGPGDDDDDDDDDDDTTDGGSADTTAGDDDDDDDDDDVGDDDDDDDDDVGMTMTTAGGGDESSGGGGGQDDDGGSCSCRSDRPAPTALLLLPLGLLALRRRR